MLQRLSVPTSTLACALAAVLAFGTAACGGPSEPAAEQAAAPGTGPTAPTAEEVQAELEAREKELAAKEAELALREKEQELARREAELAAKEAAAAKAAAAPKTSSAKPAASTSTSTAKAQAAPPPPVTVPAGTAVSVRLNEAYSTKTTQLGQSVNAELASDLVVDGRRVAKAGAPISGTVTEVTSGSQKVGAVPALKIDFTQLVVADGSTATVAVRVMQKGASEKARDTAKIAGGAAAGAIIGHQIDDDKGKIIGGLLGGAAGTVAAKKTGTEVEIAAGSVVPATVRTAFEYRGK